MVGGEHFLQISAPRILRFGIDSVLKILNERISYSMNEYMNPKGVHGTSPATQGLLNMDYSQPKLSKALHESPLVHSCGLKALIKVSPGVFRVHREWRGTAGGAAKCLLPCIMQCTVYSTVHYVVCSV